MPAAEQNIYSEYDEKQEKEYDRVKGAEKKKTRKEIIIFLTVFSVSFLIIEGIILLQNIPVVDRKLLGTWYMPGLAGDVLHEWTFRSNGTMHMSSGALFGGGVEEKYTASNGTLTIKPNSVLETTYTYQFGKMDGGQECIILDGSSGRMVLIKRSG